MKWTFPLAVLVLAAAAVGGWQARQYYPAAAVPRDEGVRPVESRPSHDGSGIEFSADAAAHPDQSTVRWLLTTYFDAINFRRYDTWKSTVAPSKWSELPHDKWMQEYQSTHDSDVVVQRIEQSSDGSLRVMLTFDSHQDPQDAPPQLPEPCVRWSVIYSLVPDSGGLRLDTTRLPGSALVARCT
ncbi:hypothetical protein [Saccharopolyspora rosea]|uniref:Uncharacterized protein n=1 Tax=Saccharopolyspora rosea TaxID=524884 RepID=A0ABW3FYE2_9PSEU|nr:hypothetical protein [Saccharopolyspora rosea]